MAPRRAQPRPGRPTGSLRPREGRRGQAAAADARAGRAAADAQRLLALLTTVVGSAFKQIVWQASCWELTFAQSQVLFHVERHPGSRMKAVAWAFSVTLPAVTQIVDRLEQKGFLARGADPADRRAATLTLTPEGAALAAEIQRARAGAMEAVLDRIPARDRPRVLEGLEALVRAATTGARPGAPDGPGRRPHAELPGAATP